MLGTPKDKNTTKQSKDYFESVKIFYIFVSIILNVINMDTKNGQSAAKLLNSNIEHGESSETISKESREEVPETGEIDIFLYRYYYLADPRNNLPRYVGRTRQSLQQRLRGHITESLRNIEKNGNGNKKENWIYKLYLENIKPIIIEIKNEMVTIYESAITEKNLILEYLELYPNLLNDEDHGIGLVFGNYKSKYVYQYDLEGNFIKQWFNANTVASELGYNDGNIGRCCRYEEYEGQLSAYGYYWSYIKYDKYPIRKNKTSIKKVYKFNKDKQLIDTFDSAKEASENANTSYKFFCSKCNNCKLHNGYYYSYNIDCTPTQKTKTIPVLCFNKDNQLIKEYNSINEAAKELGLSNGSSIIQCCKGKQKTAKGYIWKYKDVD